MPPTAHMRRISTKVFEIFQSHDVEGNGCVPSEALGTVLSALDPNTWREPTFLALLKAYGKRKNSDQIQYADFLAWVAGDKIDLLKTCVKGNVKDLYTIDGAPIGEGAFGTVSIAVQKNTGNKCAVKTIRKQSGNLVEQRKILDQEICVMKQMDHPNIVRLYEVIEDAAFLHMAMEFCAGGALLDAIIYDDDRKFDEQQCANIMQQIVGGIGYMHSIGACHRDIKLENFLLRDQDVPLENAVVKIVDFGLARFLAPGELAYSLVGTPLYRAPEFLRGEGYGVGCDNWSIGVLTYILLCGKPPFRGGSDDETYAMAAKGEPKFPALDWDEVSDDGKDFIRRLLTVDATSRITAGEAIGHIWIHDHGPKAKKRPLRKEQLKSMREFGAMNRLKKATLCCIAQRLADSEIQHLKDMFSTMDEDKDGMISYQQLKECIHQMQTAPMSPQASSKMQTPKSPSKASKEADEGDALVQPTLKRQSTAAVMDTIADIDMNWSRRINYTEFLAATLDKRHYQEERRLWDAFQMLDKGGDGKICRKDLVQLLHNCEEETLMNSVAIDQILEEADANGDGSIDFEDFVVMMR